MTLDDRAARRHRESGQVAFTHEGADPVADVRIYITHDAAGQSAAFAAAFNKAPGEYEFRMLLRYRLQNKLDGRAAAGKEPRQNGREATWVVLTKKIPTANVKMFE